MDGNISRVFFVLIKEQTEFKSQRYFICRMSRTNICNCSLSSSSLITCSSEDRLFSFLFFLTKGLNIYNVLLHRGFASINHRCFQSPGGMFINAEHLKTSSTDYHSKMFACHPSTHTHTLTFAFSLGSLFVPYD